MKQFTIGALFLVSLVAQSRAEATCGGFPGARISDCEKLIDDHLGDGTLAPVANGQAAISFGTCALVTRPSAGQAVNKDYLARRGNTLYYKCDTPLISGYTLDPESGFKRTCMLDKNSISRC